MADEISVEVVFATPGEQRLVSLSLPPGSTVNDAIVKSRLDAHFPSQDFAVSEVGIWGRVVERDQELATGDRVEIYRPLKMDPREARRRLAAAGQTMARTNKR